MLLILVLYTCLSPFPTLLGKIVFVSREESGRFQILEREVVGWLVKANFTNKIAEDGWNYLDIIGNPEGSDEDVAIAAGLAEGHLTGDLILNHYLEFIDKSLCQVDANFCLWMLDVLRTNRAWALSMAKDRDYSAYWKMIKLFYDQLKGLAAGLDTMPPSAISPRVTDGMSSDDRVLLLTFLPDIGDYIHKYKNNKLQVSVPSCSVLIKKLGDEILVSHATWHEYRAMPFRFMKRYNLPYSMTGQNAAQTIPGREISMSSYAGLIYSLDDLYVIPSSGLVTLETTLFVFNTSLFQKLDHSNQLFEPVRVMAANRLSQSGAAWAQIFEVYNSGTYNNQWMVIDYKQKAATSGILYVLEQLPGFVEHDDVTSILLDTGYWASYNRAYFQSIFDRSGAKEKEAEYGSWFSYSQTARAKILRSTQNTVKDKDSLYYLMRFNDYENSPYSTPPGCNGTIPAAAIAARSDLQESNVNCVWSQHDFMVGRRNYGAIDIKIVDSESVKSGSMLAEAGPTHLNPRSPFRWKDQDIPEFSAVREYNFSQVEVGWSAALPNEGRAPATTSFPLPIPIPTPGLTLPPNLATLPTPSSTESSNQNPEESGNKSSVSKFCCSNFLYIVILTNSYFFL